MKRRWQRNGYKRKRAMADEEQDGAVKEKLFGQGHWLKKTSKNAVKKPTVNIKCYGATDQQTDRQILCVCVLCDLKLNNKASI